MRRLVTLLAVEDIGLLGVDACSTLPLLTSACASSTGGILTPLLALPNESFHFDGFFEITDDEEEEVGTKVVDTIDDEKGKGALGTMAGGPISEVARPLEVDTACDRREVRLISRANA